MPSDSTDGTARAGAGGGLWPAAWLRRGALLRPHQRPAGGRQDTRARTPAHAAYRILTSMRHVSRSGPGTLRGDLARVPKPRIANPILPASPSTPRTTPSGWPRASARSTPCGSSSKPSSASTRSRRSVNRTRQRIDVRELLGERDADVFGVGPLHRAHLLGASAAAAGSRLAELDAAALLHVVARVHRQLADDVALDDRLAAEPRLRRQVPRGVEAIRLVVLHLAQVLRRPRGR